MRAKYIILSEHNGAYALSGKISGGFRETVLTGWPSANNCTHLPIVEMDEGFELIVKLENIVNDKFFLVKIPDNSFKLKADISIVMALKLGAIQFKDIHDSWSGFTLC